MTLISRKKYKEFGPGWRGYGWEPQWVPGVCQQAPSVARRRTAERKKESVDKPGSVVDDHSSATGVTTCL